jgi:ABC-type uncharacterized transport system substrate-binding protein
MAPSKIERMIRPYVLPGLLVSALVWSAPALAHPHVWVTARAEVLYAPDGKVTGVRHAWTFDKAYSAYVTQGLDADKDGKITPEEMRDLARENTETLVDFDYFTILKANGAKQAFAAPQEPRMAFENEAVTLTYVLPLKAPANAGKALSLEVADPTFFIAFALADGDGAVTLSGAPKGCATTISRPKPLDTAQQQKLSEAFFDALTAASNFGAQFANRAIVACP